MKFHLHHLAAAVCCAFISTTHAQEPVAPPPPAPAVEVQQLDPKVLKQYEALLSEKFSRDPAEIYRSLERTITADSQNTKERFVADFRTGDWAKVRTHFAAMPPELSRKI